MRTHTITEQRCTVISLSWCIKRSDKMASAVLYNFTTRKTCEVEVEIFLTKTRQVSDKFRKHPRFSFLLQITYQPSVRLFFE